MILVVLGTYNMQFTRPLVIIEELIKEGIITEKVIVQSGHTIFHSEIMDIIPFFEPKYFEKLYQAASYIICQAGVGSILLGLQNNKKVISIARKKYFHEHVDDHQNDILNLFYKNNFVLKWNGEHDLVDLMKEISHFKPDKYVFTEEKISNSIMDYINNDFIL